jgi:hypothetical protein
MTDESTDHARRADLITAAETIARLARDIGPEQARDILEDHMALDDPDETDEWRLIFDGISDTLRRAADQREGGNRWITIHDASDKSCIQFAWNSAEAPVSRAYADTIRATIRNTLGPVAPVEATE